MITKITGYSDDVVCIESDCQTLSEEFYPKPEGFYIFLSDGTVLDGEYDNEGEWKFRVRVQGFNVVRIEPPKGDSYSDTVTIIGDLDWVGHGDTLIRKTNKDAN